MSLEKYKYIWEVPKELWERSWELAFRNNFNMQFCTILYDSDRDNISLVNNNVPPMNRFSGASEDEDQSEVEARIRNGRPRGLL